MKTLYILRHGKSSWENLNIKDFDRPLLKEGVERTMRIADFINKYKFQIQCIVSSNAVRAFSTAKIIASETSYPISKIKQVAELYSSDAENYFNTVFGIDDNFNSLMIVGHNPSITEFANYFIDEKIDNLPTSGLIIIRFDCKKWSEISTSSKELRHVVFPKELK